MARVNHEGNHPHDSGGTPDSDAHRVLLDFIPHGHK